MTMVLNFQKRSALLLLAGLSCLLFTGCDSSPTSGVVPAVTRAREYVVEVVTQTGEYIVEHAATFAEAIQLAWRRWFPDWDGNIEISAEDPHIGTLQGTYKLKLKILEEGRQDELEFKWDNPKMRRATVDSPWEVDPSEYPPGV